MEEAKDKAALEELIKEADMVLIGTGDEFSKEKNPKEKIVQAYNVLAEMIQGKPWFVVTVNTDDLIYQSELNDFFIVAPCGSEAQGNVVTDPDYDESKYLPQWQFYMNWLSTTIGKKLLILELGVGMKYPSVIRMPFERLAMFNQKAKIVRIHSKLAQLPDEIQEKGLCISENTVDFLIKINKKD